MPTRWSLLVLPLVIGCGGSTLVVESDTSWAGTVAGFGAISGRFRAEYDLRDASKNCWTISKTTEAGTLRAYATTSEWFGLGSEVSGEATTSDPMGSVTGCLP